LFTPTADRLIPELTPHQELALLARALWREGYDDHLAGHITMNLGDGTLLCNPWLLTWEEIRPEHVLHINLNGDVVEGEWPVPLGIPLHLELHKRRPDIAWAAHSHPRFGTVWAGMGEVPPILDQSSALGGGGHLVLVDEYSGPVNDPSSAGRAVEAMGDASLALLAGHGVFVLGGSARAVHQRAVALEQRCRNAWYARAAGNPVGSRGSRGSGGSADSRGSGGSADSAGSLLPASFIERMAAGDGEGFHGFFEAAVRIELRSDPTLLD